LLGEIGMFFSERLVSVPDRPRLTSLFFTQQCQDKYSVKREADEKKRNSSTIGGYFLDVQKNCN